MRAYLLTEFNQLPAAAACQALLACCSAPSWAEQMTAGRPYASAQDAVRRSRLIVATLTQADLDLALAGHPRIGERVPQDERVPQEQWSGREQAGVSGADAQTRRALAEANLEYERRFGHIYLVCASGRTAEQLLSLLRARLSNDARTECQVVRSELQKINGARLRQLLAGPA